MTFDSHQAKDTVSRERRQNESAANFASSVARGCARLAACCRPNPWRAEVVLLVLRGATGLPLRRRADRHRLLQKAGVRRVSSTPDGFGDVLLGTLSFSGRDVGFDSHFPAAASGPLARRVWPATNGLEPRLAAGRAGRDCLSLPVVLAAAICCPVTALQKDRLAAGSADAPWTVLDERAAVVAARFIWACSPWCSRRSRRNSFFAACCFRSSSSAAGRGSRGSASVFCSR